MKQKDGVIRLSPSTLNIFLECPRCFWLEQVRGIHRPRGIFPSLPGGMDLLIKKYFDKYRAIGKLPPELAGKVDVELFPDNELLNQWRNWRSALVYEDSETGAVLSGMLDDLGLKKSGNGELFSKVEYAPLDYKTRGFDVKEGGELFYQNQLNCYALLLRENGMKPADCAYLIYYIPKDLAEKGMVRFDIVPKKVEINPEEALKVFRAAVTTLKSPLPESHSACEYCSWGNDFLME
jgi:hypothetical protein